MDQFAATVELQRKKEVPILPMNVMLEVSARCPQKCPMCPLQGSDDRLAREEGLMKPELLRSIVDQMACSPPEVMHLHYSGESTVHPQFGEMGRYVRKVLPTTWIQYNTGGLLWTSPEKREDWLSIDADLVTFSLEANRWLHDGLYADGAGFDSLTKRRAVRAEAEKYVVHPYRAGAPWDIVVPNVIGAAITLAEMNRKRQMRTRLHVQHMVTREQQPLDLLDRDGTKRRTTWEIEFSRAYWAQYGVTVQYVPVASIGGTVDNDSMRNKAFERSPMKHCREVYTNFIVSWDGRVAPCCVDHGFRLTQDADINLSHMTLGDVWRHPALEGLRTRHRAGGGYPKQCETCLGAL
jgi:MoaA/NifB/PqqE/SkfB family radical SAM enzyme